MHHRVFGKWTLWTNWLLAAAIGAAVALGGLAAAKPARAAAAEPMYGEIKLLPYQRAPAGWLYCAGQQLPIAQNTALFSLIGTTFGGDGKTTFAVPDLRGYEPLDGLGYYIANTGVFPGRENPSGYTAAGEARLFPYSFSPGGWLPADNRELSVAENAALFQVLGNGYGGDGATTFRLPRLDPVADGIHYYIAQAGSAAFTGQELLAELVSFPRKARFPSKGGLKADGTRLPINQNQALFSLLGATFGGSGKTDFAVPDLSNDPQLTYFVMTIGIFPRQAEGTVPSSRADDYEAVGNAPLAIAAPGVLANDSGALSVVLVDRPQHGTATLQADGSFVYVPDAGYAGADSFAYKAGNSLGSGAKTTVRVNVREPEAVDRTPPVVTGVSDGAMYADSRIIVFDEGTATLDGSPFASGSTVSSEGAHTLVVADAAGNSVTVRFAISPERDTPPDPRDEPNGPGTPDTDTPNSPDVPGTPAPADTPDPLPEPGQSPAAGEEERKVKLGNTVIAADIERGRTPDGRYATKASIGRDALERALASAAKPAAALEVTSGDPAIEVELSVRAIQDWAGGRTDAFVDIRTSWASFRLPVRLLKDAPKDAVVSVSMSLASDRAADEADEAAARLNAKTVPDRPVEFGLRLNGAVVEDYGGVYVERTIVLPGAVKPDRIAAVWIGPDGGLHFAPSVVPDGGGSPAVTIRSAHGGMYTVVEADTAFADMRSHWAEADVKLLADKFVVHGISVDEFAPERRVTRAEFAALLVRALGLREPAEGQPFSDVATSDWFAGAAGAARKAGLVDGYEDGTFRPNESVTREQMVAMIARAMAAGGKPAEANRERLAPFADAGDVAEWAVGPAAQALEAGIVAGRADDAFVPRELATRAESAAMLKRMLRYLGFMN
ncbi:tail fiber protein [Paenibacillus flagellatus]|uniref:SLH domain-containing protein n=1 Tax=Paenibacillus flagellatus TaxID=2211139 RepID=A0A2V5K2X7_9BACL|nr:tail fiber protein [Paenibacillus flagellatus]PYI52154.1 hypothetical protein DLM86_22005 [Paenibacillus flagellatus]